MNVTLTRTSLRYLLRHPWQASLALAGIALGVAVVVAIDIAQHSAALSFAQSTRAVAGNATHQIVGGPQGLSDALFVKLSLAGLKADLTPVIDAPVALAGRAPESLRLLGIDPVSARPFAAAWQGRGGMQGPLNFRALMSEPGAGLIAGSTGDRLDIQPGSSLGIVAAQVEYSIDVVGTVRATNGALKGYLIVDIATAQEILKRDGRLDRIDVRVTDPATETALREQLPPGAELLVTGTRIQSIQNMTRAFNTNLTALSLLSLLVGMFLIYNTQTFLVVQRRQQFGILRALGVDKQALAGGILIEALVLGFIGTCIGLALGAGMAHVLLGFVSQTVNDLYYPLQSDQPLFSAPRLLRGMALGIGATLVAAIAPALEAAHVSPRIAMMRSTLEHKVGHLLGYVTVAGVAAIAAGVGILALPGKSVVWGFAGLFVLILGAALLTPKLTLVILELSKLWAARQFGTLGTLATRAVGASLSRTGVAIAALMLAVATTVGVGLMIGSFRDAVDDWLHTILRADMYVAETSLTTERTLTTEFMAALNAMPEIDMVSSARRIRIESARGIDNVTAFQLNARAREGFNFKQWAGAALWTAFETRPTVIISEPYAYHHQLGVGDHVTLRSDRGERAFEILGVYVDYATEQGVIAMSRRTFERYWTDRALSGIGIYGMPGVSTQTLRSTIERVARNLDHGLDIRANRELREASLAIFDRTFAITGVLRTLAATIAFIGIFGALMALQLERISEFGLYRALGLTPGQIRRLVIAETGIMGVIAGLVALPVGIVMAFVLIYVINERSFGWTMALTLSPGTLLLGLLLALSAALLAGIYPAQRMAGTPPAVALRTE